LKITHHVVVQVLWPCSDLALPYGLLVSNNTASIE